MFKMWARNHFPCDGRIVPSFYLECLIYNFADRAFLRDPVERFIHIESVIAGLSYASQRIETVAGDRDILVESEWPRANTRTILSPPAKVTRNSNPQISSGGETIKRAL
jgi:hypothetical protein